VWCRVGDPYDHAHAIAIQSRDGGPLLVGSSDAVGNQDFALAHYHAITCNGMVATWVSTADNDILYPVSCYPASGNDTLVGGMGNDIAMMDTGTDVADGGAQNQGNTALGCENVTSVP
jgi:Ca2+-binding RTX toxin-like protein